MVATLLVPKFLKGFREGGEPQEKQEPPKIDGQDDGVKESSQDDQIVGWGEGLDEVDVPIEGEHEELRKTPC